VTGAYSFLPWLRQGIGSRVTAADLDESVHLRASMRVDLRLSGERVDGGGSLEAAIGRDVELFGPGDVVGIDSRAIVRTEPRDWTTNHEPNYVAHIEFYDEDFPWRYTPAAPSGDRLRLRPWLTLVVLEEEVEFSEAGGQRPLPSIVVTTPAALPAAEDLWAWAHVHVNRSMAGSDLDTVLGEDPDLAYSRIVCPRRLGENRPYHAFLVPTFESGRLAGLGLDPAASPHATFSAWETYPGKVEPSTLPVYHRWYFRTGGEGDFESLVRILGPREVDPRVGTREIAVQDPGSDLPGIGVLRLGGALRAPGATTAVDKPVPQPFQEALAAFVNLADDYVAGTADDPDPVVTAPLYGRWHALTQRLLRDGDDWIHELNLDPRNRVAAGFGTEVVQRHQDEYVAAAWKQVGDVLEANRRIRSAQLAKEVASRWHRRHLLPLVATEPERALALTAPVHRRVVTQGATLERLRSASLLPPVTTSAALRRATRPGSRLMRALPFGDRMRPQGLLTRINAGEVSAAPPKATPAALPTVERVAEAVSRTRPPSRPSPRRLPGRPPPPGDQAAPDAARLSTALRDWDKLVQATAAAGARPARLDVGGVTRTAVGAIDPEATIPRRARAGLALPERIESALGESLQEVMAHPAIDLPMSEPLMASGTDRFVPNLDLIPANSITLLEPNQPFIEAYLAGLNHEFARELLWREYPTDNRGTTFRQFWDVRGQLDPVRDIPPLDRWARGSQLGEHDERAASGEGQLVIVIRGELLKKYPTAVVYAHRASRDRELEPLTAAEEAAPPRAKVRTPLFEAKIEPDIYLLGFDLTADAAKGASGGDPGWFFVIKERPGEPRFGFDVGRAGPITTFNDLAWDDAIPGGAPGDLLRATSLAQVALAQPGPGDAEKVPQRADDVKVAAGPPSAARWAYLLYQAPVMVAVHAAELL
jgi:hypothetical protein